MHYWGNGVRDECAVSVRFKIKRSERYEKNMVRYCVSLELFLGMCRA